MTKKIYVVEIQVGFINPQSILKDWEMSGEGASQKKAY